MNFVAKNLGWILLLLFFLFMLFIISSNGGGKQIAQSGAVLSTDSGSTQEDLDSLVKLIDDEEEITEEVTEGEMMSDEVNIMATGSVKKRGGLFSFMNWGKNDADNNDEGENVSDLGSVISENVKEKTEDNNDEGENVSDSGSVISENVKEKNISVIPRSDLIGTVGDSSSSQSNNMMKKSGGSKAHLSNEAHLYASEVLGHSNMYPGINLETQVGMELEIGVHSLKLNNKYFNETLGYLMKGDSLTQLTQENNFGCFQVEVTNSTYSHNVGKTGYVCKKYLQAPGQTKTNTIVEDIIETNVGSTISTEIGDFIVVEKDNVMLGGSLLEKGAFIDKFSDTVNGCFVAHVYKSINPANQGKVGVVCETNLY